MRFTRKSRVKSIGLLAFGTTVYFLFFKDFASNRWSNSGLNLERNDKMVQIHENEFVELNMIKDENNEIVLKLVEEVQKEPAIQDVLPAPKKVFPGRPLIKANSHEFYTDEELEPWRRKPQPNPSDPGEYGKAHKIEKPSEEEKRLVKEGWDNHAFNQHVCSKISLHRHVGDRRDQECRARRWRKPLPTTSVIIVFHNEAWCTLLRTVYSVLETSPKILLKEIILVDDASTNDYLHAKLDEYVKQLSVVHIIRMPERSGLIRARLAGAEASTGDVLTFLDAHCECASGWLEPLLERIGEDPTVVMTPVIEVIDSDTFAMGFSASRSIQVGILTWSLGFNWSPQKNRPSNQPNDQPVKSPTMAGGLFSMDRAYFYFLGSYDEQMQVWGGENIEMSLRIWMCGGTLEIHPCSHVGHVFRKRAPYSHPGGSDVITRNSKRVADVWLDGYKEQYYRRVPRARKINAGDLTSRKQLREDLGCKSFEWYLSNIYPDLYAPPASDIILSGEWVNEAKDGKYCMDSANPDGRSGLKTGMYVCHGMGGNQDYMFTKQGEIRHNFVKELCLQPDGSNIVTKPCVYPHGDVPSNQKWEFTNDAHIRHLNTGLCMESVEMEILLKPCIENLSQRWQHRNLKGS